MVPVSWTEHAARQSPSCSGRNTTSSAISAVFALGHVFKVLARFSRNPRTEHPWKIFVTAGLQGWTPFHACDRIRLLGSLQTHVNAGPCSFCRRDPVVKDSRQLHCGHQSLVSEHRAQAAVTEASCGAPTVACHISRHRPLGCWREITHKGTLDPRHLHVQQLFTRPDTCSLSVVANLTPPPLSLTTRTSNRTSRVRPAAS